MPYTAEISRKHPTAFLFVIDRSGSMNEMMSETASKAKILSDVMNRFFSELLIKCTKTEGIRNYFEVGVLAYADQVVNPLAGELHNQWMNPVSLFETNVLKMEERTRKVPDDLGGYERISVKFPLWFEPVGSGGTSMCAALGQAYSVLEDWCNSHPKSYPPTVVHITDGASTDGDPEPWAQKIQSLTTSDGNVLIFNLHLSSTPGREILFPDSENGLPDKYAEKLFRMSSYLPNSMVTIAKQEGIQQASTESRGFAYNVQDVPTLVDFLDIGTRGAIESADADR